MQKNICIILCHYQRPNARLITKLSISLEQLSIKHFFKWPEILVAANVTCWEAKKPNLLQLLQPRWIRSVDGEKSWARELLAWPRTSGWLKHAEAWSFSWESFCLRDPQTFSNDHRWLATFCSPTGTDVKDLLSMADHLWQIWTTTHLNHTERQYLPVNYYKTAKMYSHHADNCVKCAQE